MNIEEQLKRYRENQNIIPDEQHIKETVRKSIESYCSVEQEKQLTYWEFYGQSYILYASGGGCCKCFCYGLLQPFCQIF